MMSILVFLKVISPALTPASCPAKALRVSGCSHCRPSLDDPSRGTARHGAPENSPRRHPDHRRDSDGWRDVGRIPSGIRSRSGCPDLGPSKTDVLHPSSGLETQETKHRLLLGLSAASESTAKIKDNSASLWYLEQPFYYYLCSSYALLWRCSPRGISMAPTTAPRVFWTASPTFLAIRVPPSSSKAASSSSAAGDHGHCVRNSHILKPYI